MKVQILHGLNGARQAVGTVVIVDVFRAFTVEAFLYEKGVVGIYPTGSIGETEKFYQIHPDAIRIGERHGIMIEGYDFGNSPSAILQADLAGKTAIHTTSAGTQGLVSAERADRIFTGALVNARATAEYIRQFNPQVVSIVAMGMMGETETEEDNLCADYLKALLEGRPFDNIKAEADALRYTEGKKFFDPARPEFPEADFACCTDVDRIGYAIEVIREDGILKAVRRKTE